MPRRCWPTRPDARDEGLIAEIVLRFARQRLGARPKWKTQMANFAGRAVTTAHELIVQDEPHSDLHRWPQRPKPRAGAL